MKPKPFDGFTFPGVIAVVPTAPCSPACTTPHLQPDQVRAFNLVMPAGITPAQGFLGRELTVGATVGLLPIDELFPKDKHHIIHLGRDGDHRTLQLEERTCETSAA